MSKAGDLLWSHKSRAIMRYVIVALLVVVAWQVSRLADRANEEEAEATTTEAILAEACGVADEEELERQGLIEECRLAQAGELGDAIPEEGLAEPDEEPSDVEPDVIEDDPESEVAPAPPPLGPSNEQVEAAVDDYFAANPPVPNETAIRSAVSAFLTRNPPEPGRPPTRGEIRGAVEAALLANPPEPGEDGADGAPGEPGPQGPPPSPEAILAAVESYCAINNGCVGPQGPAGADGQNGQNGQDGVADVSMVGCEQQEGTYIDSVVPSYDASTRTITITCTQAEDQGLVPGGGSETP